jgi:hypothetical protein
MTGLLPPWGSPEGECDDAGEDPAAQRIAGSVGPLGRRVSGFGHGPPGREGGVDRPIDRPTEGRGREGDRPADRPTDRPEGTDRPTDRRGPTDRPTDRS